MADIPFTPQHILTAFQAADTPITPDRARRLADEIVAHGSLDRAICALAHDQAFRHLDDALAYRALLAEAERPQAAAARLLRQAGDLEAPAARAWNEAAVLRGKATFRLAQGEQALAGQLLAQAEAAERLAADMEAQAFALRLQAARRHAAASVLAALFDLAA